jgi:hypothetical protein
MSVYRPTYTDKKTGEKKKAERGLKRHVSL